MASDPVQTSPGIGIPYLRERSHLPNRDAWLSSH